jgi:hypothetical protein
VVTAGQITFRLGDMSMPQWRLQASTAAGLTALRRRRPSTGCRYEPDPEITWLL